MRRYSLDYNPILDYFDRIEKGVDFRNYRL